MEDPVTSPVPVACALMRSAEFGKIAAALAAAQGEMTAALKENANPAFKSRYADLASVLDACRPALSKAGIAITQPPSITGADVAVETWFLHSSGEFLACRVTAKAKGTDPQSIGSTITYLRRYGLMALAGVAPDDDDDGNAASRRREEPRPRFEPSREEAAPAPRPGIPLTVVTVEQYDAWAARNSRSSWVATDDATRAKVNAWLADPANAAKVTA